MAVHDTYPTSLAQVDTLAEKGFLTAPISDEFAGSHTEDLLRIFEAHAGNASLVRTLSPLLENKDERGRLVPGIFAKPDDDMLQINILDRTDRSTAPQEDRLAYNGCGDLVTCARALGAHARILVADLATTIDAYTQHRTCRTEGPLPAHQLASLVKDSRIITSLTRYRARRNSVLTSPAPNTAAFGLYWFTASNPGMHIFDKHMRAEDVTSIEQNPSKALIIPGWELSLATCGVIDASMNPVYPEQEDMIRATLRTFVYFSAALMESLERERRKATRVLVE